MIKGRKITLGEKEEDKVMAVIKKQSLVDQIYDEIRGQIVGLELPFESKLNVNELQDKFGVSSTPIREAINRLQKEGLVEYENNIGARVIGISAKDVQEIQEVALALDFGAIRYAMRKGKNKEIAEEILQCIDSYKNAETNSQRTKCATAISEIFYKYAGNSRLNSNLSLISGPHGMIRCIYARQDSRVSSYKDFMAMYNGVVNSDPSAVMDALENNALKARKIIIEALENKTYI